MKKDIWAKVNSKVQRTEFAVLEGREFRVKRRGKYKSTVIVMGTITTSLKNEVLDFIE